MYRTLLIAVLAAVAVAFGAGVAQARTSLVEVDARGAAGAMKLDRLGLDVVHIDADAVEVQLHGAQDEQTLRASGLDARVLIADMDRQNSSVRDAEERQVRPGVRLGGAPAGRDRTASNHRGEAPWSEPEIRNMRTLSAANQVTVAINNHTPDEGLLRAPSSSNEPVPADVAVYDALAQLLAPTWTSRPARGRRSTTRRAGPRSRPPTTEPARWRSRPS